MGVGKRSFPFSGLLLLVLGTVNHLSPPNHQPGHPVIFHQVGRWSPKNPPILSPCLLQRWFEPGERMVVSDFLLTQHLVTNNRYSNRFYHGCEQFCGTPILWNIPPWYNPSPTNLFLLSRDTSAKWPNNYCLPVSLGKVCQWGQNWSLVSCEMTPVTPTNGGQWQPLFLGKPDMNRGSGYLVSV